MVPSTVLIIDDDPLFQLLAEETFRNMGAQQVLTADDGVQGLARLRRSVDAIDLVLLDLQMPQLDGVSVARSLGEMGYSGALIIASSEDASVIEAVRNMAEMLGAGILGALRKPLKEPELRALLDSADAQPAHTPSRPRPALPEKTSRMALLADLADGRIVPVYQPKLDLRTMRVASVEVLARWRNADGALGSAGAQLGAAETHGLITRLTLAMLERTMVDALRLRADGFELGFALNVSPSSLVDRTLPDMLIERIRAAGMSPTQVTLEITENRLLEFNAEVLEVLSRLRVAGFRLSIDDFGTGATSVETLRRFPINELKIDAAFIQGASHDAVARETVLASARIARELRLDTVAEGIETDTHLRVAVSAGIGYAQGFMISRPKPADALADWLRGPARKLAAVA